MMLGALQNDVLALLRRERIEGEGAAHEFYPHPTLSREREREINDGQSKIISARG